MVRNYLFNLQGVDIYTIANFLDDLECDHLCSLIQANHSRSGVTGEGRIQSILSESRTSSTAQFDMDDDIVKEVNRRIAEEVGVPGENAERIEGQLYQEDQKFDDHTDYFEDDSFINHCLASGQRTWTAMIYLNNVDEGGFTEFPIMGKIIPPQKGTAVFWKNAEGEGSENIATLHTGRPVIKGKKMIITQWFREYKYQPDEDRRLAEVYHDKNLKTYVKGRDSSDVKIEYVDGIAHARYRTKSNIPAITKEGFKKVKIPSDLYSEIMRFYEDGKTAAHPEFDPHGDDDVKNFISSKEEYYPTEMIPLTQEMRTLIFESLIDIHKEWSGRELEQTHCYGIRTYKRGAILTKHTDGFETRIISSILNVDQKVDEPWALQIDDHQGVEHEVFLKPGEMVLYESAILEHGRVKPFNGDYFSNLFVHYVNLT